MHLKQLIASRRVHYVTGLALAFFVPNAAWYAYFHERPFTENLTEFVITNSVNSLPYVTFFLIAFIILPRLLGMLLLSVSLFAISMASWFGIAHYQIFGHPINSTSFYIALNSNLLEIREFVATYKTLPIFVILATLFVLELVMVWIVSRYHPTDRREKIALFAIAASMMYPSWELVSGRTVFADDNMIFMFRDAVSHYQTDLSQIAKVGRGGDAIYSVKILPQLEQSRETYVLVLGESTSRSHMGIYGYYRDTTPCLNQISTEIYRFTDVISPHSHTFKVMQKALTVRDHNIPHDDRDYSFSNDVLVNPNIIGLMKKGGFRTYWLSNQMVLGKWDLWNTFFSEAADRRVFTNISIKEDSYDDALLPHLKSALADPAPKKLIILHLMGTHTNAAERYPLSFAKYASSGIPIGEGTLYPTRSISIRNYINVYDDAVRYGDSFLKKTFDLVKLQQGMRFLVYFSDHGEEVGEIGEYLGHTEKRGSRYMFEIPFLFWGSREYLEARPAIAQQLPQAISRPYQTDDFMHTFMDLAGVWTESFCPEKSVVNCRFRARKRMVRGVDYEVVRREN